MVRFVLLFTFCAGVAKAEDRLPATIVLIDVCANASISLRVALDGLAQEGWRETAPDALPRDAIRALAAKLATRHWISTRPTARWKSDWQRQLLMADAFRNRKVLPDAADQLRFATHNRFGGLVEVATATRENFERLTCSIVSTPEMSEGWMAASPSAETPPLSPAEPIRAGDLRDSLSVDVIVFRPGDIEPVIGDRFGYDNLVTVTRTVWRSADD